MSIRFRGRTDVDLMTAVVELQNITKFYGAFCALNDVSCSIPPGVTGLLGPNGAGKSTLIKILLGLVRVSSGRAWVLGCELPEGKTQIRSRVGYMPEDDCYFAGLSGVEAVRYLARLSGIPSREALRRAHEILDFCDAGQERYRDVETYSTGMRQKVKFAAAMVHDPDLLILDEPTAGLDPEERDRMLTRIGALAREAGKSILISTHILPDVQATCDSVAFMAKGRIRMVESLAVLSKPAEPAVHLRLLGSSERFQELAVRDGYQVESGSPGTLTIRPADEQLADRIWQWARDAGVAVKSLVPSRNSLEQVFLECVREG